jgi:D-cysteine desulfhydrase
VRALAAGAAAVAGIEAGLREPTVLGGWIGPGYGVPSEEGQAAARMVAAAEGVFLDPTFGAKAMAALIAECRAGRVSGPQVFLVSGGAPTLFAGAGGTGSGVLAGTGVTSSGPLAASRHGAS